MAHVLDLTADEAAGGVAEVVDENMANAARVHAVENGKDVSKYTMIAFGGGAPLHAGRLCDKLDVDELLVPPGASVGSAIGFLRAPFAYEALRSHHVAAGEFDADAVNLLLSGLADEATSFVTAALAASDDTGDPPALETERCAFMRYAGQGWEIPVRLEGGPFDHLGGELLANRFEKAYEEFFGRAIAGLAVEAISWSVRVTTPRPPVQRVERVEALREVAIQRTRPVHDAGTDSVVVAAVVEREALSPGDRVAGPAVIVDSNGVVGVFEGEEKKTAATTSVPGLLNDSISSASCTDFRSDRGSSQDVKGGIEAAKKKALRLRQILVRALVNPTSSRPA